MLPIPPSSQIGTAQPRYTLGLLQVPPTPLFLPVHSCRTAFLQLSSGTHAKSQNIVISILKKRRGKHIASTTDVFCMDLEFP